MKPLTRTELRQITGTASPGEQMAILRRRGIYPFECPKTGRPLVYGEVVAQSMLVQDNGGTFVGNMEAFN